MSILSPLKADCIIFDVDGVLMNTDKSFPNVIKNAIPRVWESLLGRKVDGNPFSQRHFETSKQFSSLNDDYDICWGLVSLAASKGNDSLEGSFPSPWEWEETMKSVESSGLTLIGWMGENLDSTVPYDETRKCCEELYFGAEKTRELLGREAKNQDDYGFWREETPMIRRHWKKIPLPVGIYTGRSRKELALALESMGWEDLPRDMAVCSDDGIKKPSPEGLELLCRRMERKWPLFFGDTASDRASLRALGKGDFMAVGNMLKDVEFRFSNVEDAIRALGL